MTWSKDAGVSRIGGVSRLPRKNSTRSAMPFALALAEAMRTIARSKSSPVTRAPGTRSARHSAAAPAPAPTSRTRSPFRAENRGGEEHRVDADAIAARRLAETDPPVEKGVLGHDRHARRPSSCPSFRICQRPRQIGLLDHNAPADAVQRPGKGLAGKSVERDARDAGIRQVGFPATIA